MEISNKIKIIFFGGSKYSEYYKKALEESGLGKVYAFNKLPPQETLAVIKPDLGVIAYFGQIVPPDFLKIPRFGFINVHYSLLPRWRGAAPVQAAILAGDTETGVSILVATARVDAGAILSQEKIQILPEDTYTSLEERLIPIGSKLLVETIPKFLEDKIIAISQDESKVTYTRKYKTEDGKINWSSSANEIIKKIRALNPNPGTYTFWQGKRLITLEAKSELLTHQFETGQVVNCKESFKIAVPDGFIIPLKIKLEGKREVDPKDFLRGHRDFLSARLS